MKKQCKHLPRNVEKLLVLKCTLTQSTDMMIHSPKWELSIIPLMEARVVKKRLTNNQSGKSINSLNGSQPMTGFSSSVCSPRMICQNKISFAINSAGDTPCNSIRPLTNLSDKIETNYSALVKDQYKQENARDKVQIELSESEGPPAKFDTWKTKLTYLLHCIVTLGGSVIMLISHCKWSPYHGQYHEDVPWIKRSHPKHIDYIVMPCTEHQ